MPISDTNFFNNYQNQLGGIYARGYQESYNPATTLLQYENTRQLFIGNLGVNDVSNSLTVINAHLAAETTYLNSTTQIVKNVLTNLNNFFNNTYGSFLRDFFCSIGTTRVPWLNSYKEAWYQANTQELVQQIGFATYNGTKWIIYPAYSSLTNVQNQAGVLTTSGNNITISGYTTTLPNFALPGDLIFSSNTGSLPTPQNISFATSVVGYLNTNTLILSGPIGSATSLFAYRNIKNPEYLEFRFGTAGVTGLACTQVFSDIYLNVTLNTLTGLTTSVVWIGATNVGGRVNIGTYGNTAYKATSIGSITINSGSITGLGTNQSLEVWVKSIN